MSDDPTNPPSTPPGGDPSLPPTEPMPATPPPGGPPPTGDALAAQQAAAEAERAHWYDNRGAVAGVIVAGILVLVLLIAGLLWWADDDDDEDAAPTIPTASIVTGSTIDVDATTTTTSSTIPPASIVTGSTIDVTPVSTTTTTSTTTAPTTTEAATTTSAPPETTTTVPVVTVPPSSSATVMDIIAASPDLSRLNELIERAGLADDLAAQDPLTLFAPSNPAIETLEAAPGGADLLADPARLEQLLLRHAVADAVDSATLFTLTEVETLFGDTLTVDAADQTVDGASVLVADVAGANGFLHVVDAVLIAPPTG